MVWLVFSRLKIVRCGWLSGSIAAMLGAVGGAGAYPETISIPEGYEKNDLKLGMPGTATVFSANAGVIVILKSFLVWVSSYTAYLWTGGRIGQSIAGDGE